MTVSEANRKLVESAKLCFLGIWSWKVCKGFQNNDFQYKKPHYKLAYEVIYVEHYSSHVGW